MNHETVDPLRRSHPCRCGRDPRFCPWRGRDTVRTPTRYFFGYDEGALLLAVLFLALFLEAPLFVATALALGFGYIAAAVRHAVALTHSLQARRHDGHRGM